jgi:hypothetical protein
MNTKKHLNADAIKKKQTQNMIFLVGSPSSEKSRCFLFQHAAYVKKRSI